MLMSPANSNIHTTCRLCADPASCTSSQGAQRHNYQRMNTRLHERNGDKLLQRAIRKYNDDARMLSSSSSSLKDPLILRPVFESRSTPAWSTNGSGRSFAARTSATSTHCTSVAVERVEEAARLQVLRRSARGQPVVLDDVSKPGETGPKPNRIDQGIDTRIDVPSAIPEDLWKQRRAG